MTSAKQDEARPSHSRGSAYTVDEAGVLMDASDSFCLLIGYTRDELAGMHASAWDQDFSAWLAAGPRLLAPSTSKTRFRRKDGGTVAVHVLRCRMESAGRSVVLVMALKIEANPTSSEIEASFNHFFENNGSIMLLIEPVQGCIVAANRAAAEYYGYPPEKMTRMHIGDVNALSREQIKSEMETAVREERAYFNFPHRLASGEIRDVEVYSAPIEVEGKVLLYSIVRDVTERRAAHSALELSELRYRTIFRTSLDAIDIRRLDNGLFIEVNQAFAEVMGYQPSEVIGRTSSELGVWVDLDQRQRIIDLLHAKSVCRNVETQFRTKSGKIFWGVISSSLIEIDGIECVLSVTRDISEAKTAEEKIRNLAFYDPLTGLVNRHLLHDRLCKLTTAAARSAQQHALLFVDLDNFKPLNDTFGHDLGDLLLQQAASRLLACVRKTDTVARLGGDEFIVILENLCENPREARIPASSVGEKILASIGAPYTLEDHEWRCTASVGIALFGEREITPNVVMQRADKAMYLAKAAGRNTLRFFDSSMEDPI